jgi:uncharacterized protein (DUF849 family)
MVAPYDNGTVVTTEIGPVIIEVALNGMTPKSRNPHVPRTPAEIAADGLRCMEAGAAIVHSHTDDPVLGGSGIHSAAPYLEAWKAILRKRPDAILYPTMASGGAHVSVQQRYGHMERLALEGVLGMGLVDPGSTNIGGVDAEGLPADAAWVYQNTHRDARYMFAACERLGVGVSISIFEPGFLRVVLAYHAAGRLPQGVFVKLYFGAHSRLSFGLPPTEPSLNAYLSMLEGTDLPWLVSAIGGDVVGCGLARMAIERGGHLQLGLECYDGDRTPTNEELVREAVDLAASLGRSVATSADARRILDLPPVLPAPAVPAAAKPQRG